MLQHGRSTLQREGYGQPLEGYGLQSSRSCNFFLFLHTSLSIVVTCKFRTLDRTILVSKESPQSLECVHVNEGDKEGHHTNERITYLL